jgi:16S rRNA (guanine1207-N2)-methyltransferase
MGHYFIEDAALQDDERELSLTIFNKNFTFLSNSGLFSYRQIDDASLLLLKHIPELEGSLLDMGCGYGVLGIVLAKIYELELTLCDINPHAIRYAERNAHRNHVRAGLILSNGFDAIESRYAAIVMNPPIHAGKETIFRMYGQARSHLAQQGSLFTVVQKKHGAESHVKKLVEIYDECLILYKKKGYYILQGKRQ